MIPFKHLYVLENITMYFDTLSQDIYLKKYYFDTLRHSLMLLFCCC